MPIKFSSLLAALIILAAATTTGADMVILKTGEIFQTRKAWKENGTVLYFKDGRVVRIDESQVERLIQSPAAVGEQPPGSDRPSDGQPKSGLPSTEQPPPQATHSDGDDVGHRNLKWGQGLSQIEGLTLVGTDPAYGGVQLYTGGSRSPRFGRASVDNIFYGFWEGGLYTILVEVSNYLDFLDLKAEAFRRYGVGNQDGEQPEKFRWMDAQSDRLLVYDDASNTGYLWMRSRAMHAKVEARYPD